MQVLLYWPHSRTLQGHQAQVNQNGVGRFRPYQGQKSGRARKGTFVIFVECKWQVRCSALVLHPHSSVPLKKTSSQTQIGTIEIPQISKVVQATFFRFRQELLCSSISLDKCSVVHIPLDLIQFWDLSQLSQCTMSKVKPALLSTAHRLLYVRCSACLVVRGEGVTTV